MNEYNLNVFEKEYFFNLVEIPLVRNEVYDGPTYPPPSTKDLLAEIDLSKILTEQTLAFVNEKMINPKSVKRLREIGRGHFGKVFKGFDSKVFYF